MTRSHKTLRVLPLLWLGLRSGPRDWPLMDTEERPSGARRGLHPSKMEVRVAGAGRTKRQTTAPHNSSHNQPSLGSPWPGAHGLQRRSTAQRLAPQWRPLLDKGLRFHPLTLGFYIGSCVLETPGQATAMGREVGEMLGETARTLVTLQATGLHWLVSPSRPDLAQQGHCIPSVGVWPLPSPSAGSPTESQGHTQASL